MILSVGMFRPCPKEFFKAHKTGVKSKSVGIGISSIKGLYDIDNELREGLKEK